MRALRLQKITMAYDDQPVIRDMTFEIEPGTLVGLLGPNGAGKSTLMLGMSGQMLPQAGSIQYGDMDIYTNNVGFKKLVGYVHEAPFFYDYLTVAEMIRFVAGVKEVALGEEQLAELLDELMLAEHREKMTSELSMGMRKKLAIACALVGDPEVVLLDEALNGIDFESAFRIKARLRSFVEGGGSVILSSHVVDVVEKLCDRFVILNRGELVSDFTAEELKDLESRGHKDLESYLIELIS